MCITAWFFCPEGPKDKFILAFNRDEQLDRGTLPAEKWCLKYPDSKSPPVIISGLDEKSLVRDTSASTKLPKIYRNAGTWLGVSDKGKLAFLTNVSSKYSQSITCPLKSRGNLVTNFLTDEDIGALEYLNSVKENIHEYDGFNLVTGSLYEKSSLMSLTYIPIEQKTYITHLNPEVPHAMSNTPFGLETQKIILLKKEFFNLKQNCKSDFTVEHILKLMGPTMNGAVNSVEDLSNHIFIPKIPHPSSPAGYATRTTTVLMVTLDEIRVTEFFWDHSNPIPTSQQATCLSFRL